MGCSSCGAVSASSLPGAAALAQAQAEVATIPRSCEEASQMRAAALKARGTKWPGLRRAPYRFRKPDPCNEPIDPLNAALANFLGIQTPEEEAADAAQIAAGFKPCRRVCRYPSVFTAPDGRAANELYYELGFYDALSDVNIDMGNRNRTSAGLTGANEQRFGQTVARSINLMQPPYRWCRHPSMFTCDDGRCQAALSVQLGLVDALNTQEQRNLNSGRNAGLGSADRMAGVRSYENLCVKVTRFGQPA